MAFLGRQTMENFVGTMEIYDVRFERQGNISKINIYYLQSVT